MKKTNLLGAALLFVSTSSIGYAQTTQPAMKKQIRKEVVVKEKATANENEKVKIEKNVMVTNENGEKVLTITTKQNDGTETKEVFRGAAAEAKLKELEAEDTMDTDKKVIEEKKIIKKTEEKEVHNE